MGKKERLGAEKWSICWQPLDMQLALEMSGDSRTCVSEAEEVGNCFFTITALNINIPHNTKGPATR